MCACIFKGKIQMTKKLIQSLLFVTLASTMSEANTFSLSQIVDSAKEHNMLSKSIEKEMSALEANNYANTASDPFELYVEGTEARPGIGSKGYEYAVGISKNILLGGIQDQEREVARLRNQAMMLDAQKGVISFSNGLKNLYHQHCLDLQKYRSFKQSFNDLDRLYKKKEKAYKYQEIAKTELMQIESEKNILSAQLHSMKMTQEISKEKILMLSKVHFNGQTKLSCRDMYPIRSTVAVDKVFEFSQSAYEKRKESSNEKLKRYSHAFESVNLSAQYGKELDIDRYTVGVSLPLNFSSKRSEHQKVAALYESEALSYTYEQNMLEKKSVLRQLKSELQSNAMMVKMLSKNYVNYEQKLLPLIKNSYDLGETSVIEYLLNRQKLYTLNQEVYATKKAYYKTLFTLYTLIEKKD